MMSDKDLFLKFLHDIDTGTIYLQKGSVYMVEDVFEDTMTLSYDIKDKKRVRINIQVKAGIKILQHLFLG